MVKRQFVQITKKKAIPDTYCSDIYGWIPQGKSKTSFLTFFRVNFGNEIC